MKRRMDDWMDGQIDRWIHRLRERIRVFVGHVVQRMFKLTLG